MPPRMTIRLRPLFLVPVALALGLLGASVRAAVVSTLYSFTFAEAGSSSRMAPISFDADSLEILHGSFLPNSMGNPTEMAVDETGRLFGYNGLTRQLAEFDPVTLAVLNSTLITLGSLHGLAAHGGTLYSFNSALAPLSFDANSLNLVRGRLVRDTLTSSTCLAVDETGRIFGYNALNHRVMELDPRTLEILHSAAVIGGLHGLAAHRGRLYSYTASDSALAPIVLDANSLTLIQGTFRTSALAAPLPDMAVDAATGRLFAFNALTHQLMELDPSTLAILDSTPIAGYLHGLAVSSVPEPALVPLFPLASAFLLRRRRGRTAGLAQRKASPSRGSPAWRRGRHAQPGQPGLQA
jgi:hypothetical protein